MSYQIFDYKNLLQNLPFEVNKIFDIFLNDIRLVGGSVRDLIIKKEVKDFDFVTKFLPEEIIKILQKNKIKALLTGVKFGTITAVLNDKNFEITTLRKELKNDGRHCEVKFVDDYAVDAARRDFTINALYFDYQGLVHDYFNGKSDLENKIVRFIGDAHQRIEEDFLRILRFFRFSCQYASNLDDQGFKACVAQKKNLIKLSKERIRQELIKLLCIDEKKAIINILKILNETKISDEIFAQSLHYQGLELSFILAEELNVNILTNLKLAFLFLQNDASHQFYWMDKICVTNSEKKYFYFLAEKLTKLNGVVDFL
jgi:poly(A) polymerase